MYNRIDKALKSNYENLINIIMELPEDILINNKELIIKTIKNIMGEDMDNNGDNYEEENLDQNYYEYFIILLKQAKALINESNSYEVFEPEHKHLLEFLYNLKY